MALVAGGWGSSGNEKPTILFFIVGRLFLDGSPLGKHDWAAMDFCRESKFIYECGSVSGHLRQTSALSCTSALGEELWRDIQDYNPA